VSGGRRTGSSDAHFSRFLRVCRGGRGDPGAGKLLTRTRSRDGGAGGVGTIAGGSRNDLEPNSRAARGLGTPLTSDLEGWGVTLEILEGARVRRLARPKRNFLERSRVQINGSAGSCIRGESALRPHGNGCIQAEPTLLSYATGAGPFGYPSGAFLEGLHARSLVKLAVSGEQFAFVRG
jgi:hypothetical protein